ncbi:MAG: hypothetical protein ACKPAE_10760, partial [Microcystis panniformis]
MNYNILYPFGLRRSQGGLFSLAQMTARAKPPYPFQKVIFHTPDSGGPFQFENADVIPVPEGNGKFPDDSWWRDNFIGQHLQAYTNSLIPEAILKEMYPDTNIDAPLGSPEYLSEFFRRYPADFSSEEEFSRRFATILDRVKIGDTLSVQGPVWFIPFIRDYGDALREKVKLVMVEHQLVPENLDKLPLGDRLIPCYLKAD